MRYISKINRCADFDNFVQRHNPANWDNNRFKQSTVKLTLHQHLLAEQQHLCIYCQQSIPPKLQKDDHQAVPPIIHPSHIEHVRPKGANHFPHLTFEYTNLSVSCDGFEIDPAVPRSSPEFCGHPKENKYDDALFLHPFEEPDIEAFFEFDVNGKIKPTAKDPLKALYTFQLLGLDKETLREMRERQYDTIIQEVNNGLDIAAYLDPNQPELPKFYSMLRQLFGLT
jgi:uncharacterized protein (TIGR02646 family)